MNQLLRKIKKWVKLQIKRAKKAKEIMKKKLVRNDDKKQFVRRIKTFSKQQSKLEVEIMITVAPTTRASKKTFRMSN